MQVFNHVQGGGAFRRSDIQIQTATAKIGVKLTGAPDAQVRLRHIAPSGTKVIQDLISLRTLLEASTFAEGFFISSDTELIGTFDLSEAGALDLKEGYLSLDVEAENLTALSVYALEAAITSNKYLSYNPVYMNGGITREINLSGVEYVLMPIDAIKTLDIDYSSRSVTYDQQELRFIANSINDLVSCSKDADDLQTNTKTGFDKIIRLAVTEASRMTITPANSVPFYAHLGEARIL